MSRVTLEKRVSELERRMAGLQMLVTGTAGPKDWRRAVGAFTDDAGMQEIMSEALRLRAVDRARPGRRTERGRPAGRK